jgi:hypothetical protein
MAGLPIYSTGEIWPKRISVFSPNPDCAASIEIKPCPPKDLNKAVSQEVP